MGLIDETVGSPRVPECVFLAMTFRDHFSTQSDRYSTFRPGYRRELFAYLAGLVPRRRRAWDCGTGNGQAATELTKFFDVVIATDPSRRQIEHASKSADVRYLVGSAENPPLADSSIDLITVAQAVHWFDRPRFYEQVRRVGTPGSVLAIWGYGLATIEPDVDAIVKRLYDPILGNYWPPERKLVEQRYASIEFPFEEFDSPKFAMTAEWDLHALLGYLGTWSSVEKYRLDRGSDPLTIVHDDLHAAWGEATTKRRVQWPLFLRAGRVH